MIPAKKLLARKWVPRYVSGVADALPLICEMRAYRLTDTAARPLPVGEPNQLDLIVSRSFELATPTFASFAGQLRPRKASISIDVRGHRRLQARGQGAREVMRVFDSEASWDWSGNEVRFGCGYIEVLCSSLRGYGIGALFMNMAIGWAQCFHPDARVREIKVGDDPFRDQRRRFYEGFGFRFLQRSDASGNLLSEPMEVTAMRSRPHPLIDSVRNVASPRSLASNDR